ncbi:hypothetical protein IWW55_007293, partial [Coemansia sp. RSA 2706]
MAHDCCGQVNMWDIRWATKPVHTFDTGQRSVLRVQFSPRRSGVIASLAADSSVFEIFTVNEFFNGHVAQTERMNARAFLDDARMKDQYDDDRMALLSVPPPPGIRIWTDQATTVPPPAAAAEPHTAFMWVPPVVSSKTGCRQQLVSSTTSGALHTTGLPLPYIGLTNCRGDVAIANNWSKLQSALPATDLEMDMLHVAVPEIHEVVVLDKTSRQSHSTQSTSAGTRGSKLALPAASAAMSASASLSSVQHAGQQPSNSNSGLLARRHQAARHNSADGDSRAAQLRERIRTMNLGLNGGAGGGSAPTASGDPGGKGLSPRMYERLVAGEIT